MIAAKVLVDSCIWVDHLGRGDEQMAFLLDQARVLIHPFIIGEVALGSLADRDLVIADLYRLPSVVRLRDAEVVQAIGSQALFGSGIGYVDTHLLVSTLSTRGATIWTRDKNHLKEAERLGIAARLTN